MVCQARLQRNTWLRNPIRKTPEAPPRIARICCTTGIVSLGAGALRARSDMPPDKVIIVPGNGGGSIRDCNWYGWMQRKLQSKGYTVAMSDMPDPVVASENIWLPFIVNELAGGAENLERCVVVGHSSGAAAAMRLAEEHKLYGMLLVAAYTSDMGIPDERASGYFSRPWQWDKQASNVGAIAQLARCEGRLMPLSDLLLDNTRADTLADVARSTDDPFLPIEEQRKVGQGGLAGRCKYVEKGQRSHWFQPSKDLMTELLWVIENGGHPPRGMGDV